MAIPQGTMLGRYEIRSMLGAGGMGEVYLANDLNLHRRVAVKVLSAGLTTNKDRLRRFEREAFTASSLNHPNILTIYEIGSEKEYHFIATEFIDGESLGQHLRRESFGLHEVLEIGIQVAAALSAAHAAGIVHRDIKPDNIMLRRDHVVKVLDFGLAKLSEPEISVLETEVLTKAKPLTSPGFVMGTARYMSPEQARGLPVDARTDIWSLGVVLYEMITSHPPFSGETISDVIVAVLTTHPSLLTTYRADVPAELERIITKTLRKNQEERYQLAKDLGLDLKVLKQRLEFEAELERSGEGRRSGEGKRILTSPEGPQIAETLVADGSHRNVSSHLHAASETASVLDQLVNAQTASSAGIILSELKKHKLGSLIALVIFIAAIVGVGYFRYKVYKGSGNSAITSIAVLPFSNTSNDPEKEYLSDGISESLINRLSQLPGMKVIANSSSSRYKGKEPDLREVARALNITGIVTGRISQRGDSLTISVELIDGRDSTLVWGEQYNRKAADVLTVQGQISREIAEKLRVRLTAGQQQEMARREKAKPEAYELLLRGRFFLNTGRTEDQKRAIEYFDRAIAVDPAYAPAYAELSDTYRNLVGRGNLDPKEYLPKAEAAAQKAIELDESLAEAHYAMANLKTYAWEWADAELRYKRALELNPNLALARNFYARYLSCVGRHEQAIAEVTRARELDPLSPPVNASVGVVLFHARQYDRAIAGLKKMLEVDQSFPFTHYVLGSNYMAKGMYGEAIAEYNEAIKLGLRDTQSQALLGGLYARAGDRERAQAILKQLLMSKESVSPGVLAILHTALGEREQAFAWLEKAYEAHDPNLQFLGVSLWFDPLRSDPRFQDLLRRVGLSR